jgi:hypothetical protein
VKRRNPFLVALYSVLTLGVYYSYWLYDMWQSLIEDGYKIPSPILAITLHLLAVFNIVFIVSPLSNDLNVLDNIYWFGILLLFVGACAVISISYWFYKFCSAIKPAINSSGVGIFDYPIVLALHYFLLFFVWAALAQNKVNKSNLFS